MSEAQSSRSAAHLSGLAPLIRLFTPVIKFSWVTNQALHRSVHRHWPPGGLHRPIIRCKRGAFALTGRHSGVFCTSPLPPIHPPPPLPEKTFANPFSSNSTIWAKTGQKGWPKTQKASTNFEPTENFLLIQCTLTTVPRTNKVLEPGSRS